MKLETRKTLYAFLAELVVYGILVVAYFFLVLHFLGDWLSNLNQQNVKLYALIAIGLIIGQAVALESLTTLIFRLMRGRSE